MKYNMLFEELKPYFRVKKLCLNIASDYESEGRTFESFRARHFRTKLLAFAALARVLSGG